MLNKRQVEDLVFKSYLEEIMKKKKFLKMNRYLQHGTTSTLMHSIAVSYYSYRLCKFLKLKVHEKELIRGALLHDYYLYDWHNKYKPTKNLGKHGFIHPKIALYNAKRDYEINELEEDIIVRHMFPLTLTPPKYKESIIVSLVDKGCSIYETFHKHAYSSLTNRVVETKKERRIINKKVNAYE